MGARAFGRTFLNELLDADVMGVQNDKDTCELSHEICAECWQAKLYSDSIAVLTSIEFIFLMDLF